MKNDYDYIIVGSGFGGSVSALRLSQKGYKVLVIEKGKWWKAKDFPKNNWDIKNWLWEPKLGLKGFFKITWLNHVTALTGVGVGGGSLTWANTMPIPKDAFFKSGSWAKLRNWQNELQPYYDLALKMLGGTETPRFGPSDRAVQQLAKEMNREEHFGPSKVAVYFGEPGKTVPDPYFDGEGPDRTGCIFCGACMTGCRHGAKNTLDKNYLYLAQKRGAEIVPETEVVDVLPIGESGKYGYRVKTKGTNGHQEFTSKGIIFSGGVMGTVPLLLKLKDSTLPHLSDWVGGNVSTNNEALYYVTSKDETTDYTEGVSIGSILHTDENSHFEPVRNGYGSGFFKVLLMPFAEGANPLTRIIKSIFKIISNPYRFVKDRASSTFSRRSTVLLFMQTLNSTIRIKRGKITPIKTVRENGPKPSAHIPEAQDIARRFSKIVNGVARVSVSETLFGIPTTAHILGGCRMGVDVSDGVIDRDNKVFGYENMYVCDGSMISANPGVNPSLSITAITEYAMTKIPNKQS